MHYQHSPAFATLLLHLLIVVLSPASLSVFVEEDFKVVLITGEVRSALTRAGVTGSIGSLLLDAGWDVRAVSLTAITSLNGFSSNPLRERFEKDDWIKQDDGNFVMFDVGYYERFMGIAISGVLLTKGSVARQALQMVRDGDFCGKPSFSNTNRTHELIQVIRRACSSGLESYIGSGDVKHWPVVPKVKNGSSSIRQSGASVGKVCVVQLTANAGLYAAQPFVAALRDLKQDVGDGNFAHVYIGVNDEQVIRSASQTFRENNVSPDMILLHYDHPNKRPSPAQIASLSAIACISPSYIEAALRPDVIYKLPILLRNQNFTSKLSQLLGRQLDHEPYAARWRFISHLHDVYARDPLDVVIVGKYAGLPTMAYAYTTLIDSVRQAALQSMHRVRIHMIDALHLDVQPTDNDSSWVFGIESPEQEMYRKSWDQVVRADGLILAGGMGARGFDGLITVTQYARQNNKPILMICLGFQAAIVEFARNVLSLKDAHSAEIDKSTRHPVVSYMPFYDMANPGSDLKTGPHFTYLIPGTFFYALYSNQTRVRERFLHSYGFNPEYISMFNEAGLITVATNDHNNRSDALLMDRSQHPYFVGVQYHSEYESRPMRSAPTIIGLVLAAAGRLDQVLQQEGQYHEAMQELESMFDDRPDHELSTLPIDLGYGLGVEDVV